MPLIPVKRFSMRDRIPRCGTGYSGPPQAAETFLHLMTVNPMAPCETTLPTVATCGAPLARRNP